MTQAAGPGHSRGERLRQVLLEMAIELVFDVGFRAVSIAEQKQGRS
ncbi:MAG: hypothetical protein JO114_23585 [Planctomycetaceae bacterium]|nr:hypothetical protein [Planctomycetaceae bacterium]